MATGSGKKSLGARLRLFLAAWFGFVALAVVFLMMQMLPASLEGRYAVRIPLCMQSAEAGRAQAFLEDTMRRAGAEHWRLAEADRPVEGCATHRQHVLTFDALLSRRGASALFNELFEAGPAAGVYPRGLSYQTSPAGTGTVTYAVSAIASAMLALGFWWLVRKRGCVREPPARIGAGRLVAGALAATSLALTGAMAYGWILQATGIIQMPQQPDPSAVTPLLLLTAVVLAPVAEEVVFRFWLLDRMVPAISPVAALLLSSAVFSMVHLEPEPFAFGSRLITGLVLGVLWLRTSSLGACVLAHGLFNAAVFGLDHLAGG